MYCNYISPIPQGKPHHVFETRSTLFHSSSHPLHSQARKKLDHAVVDLNQQLSSLNSFHLQISHHCTTKALDRAGAPSPIHSQRTVSSSQSRFGPWPSNNNGSNSPRPRQHHHSVAAQESWHQTLRILRGRPIERLLVLLALLVFTAFLAYHHDRLHFVDSATHHLWNSPKHRFRLDRGDSLIPSWSRVDWSEFAYVSYALSPENVCNSVMLAESLWRLEARAETLVLVAGEKVGGDGQSSSSSARLLQQASDFYGARVKAVKVLSSSFNADIVNNNNSQNEPQKPYDNTWSHSLTKLLTFNQKRYKRVLGLDSDATLLKPMDDLFLLPPQPP